MFITDEIELSALSYPLYSGCDLSKALFFDIETSGMSFDRSHTTVIGAAHVRNDKLIFMQWFADVPGSEPYILADFFERTAGFDTLVTYNGAGFDVPYMEKKAEFWSLPCSLTDKEQLDLYRFSGPFAKLFGLENRKLKTIERGLYLERNDRVSGAECIDLYRGWLSSGDEQLRDLILLHNREDVANLVDVLHILSYQKLREGNFEVEEASAGDSLFEISCTLSEPLPRSFARNLPDLNISAKDGRMKIAFHGRSCEKKLFRKDYKNYYYLKNEDCAVHKSIGQFLPKESRVRAKASNCYEKITDVFFEQPDAVILPDFKDACRDKASFFRAQEASSQPPHILHDLCSSVLKRYIFRPGAALHK